jgi:hypothetical protein
MVYVLYFLEIVAFWGSLLPPHLTRSFRHA